MKRAQHPLSLLIWRRVFDFIDDYSLDRIPCVCKWYRQSITEPQSEGFWKARSVRKKPGLFCNPGLFYNPSLQLPNGAYVWKSLYYKIVSRYPSSLHLENLESGVKFRRRRRKQDLSIYIDDYSKKHHCLTIRSNRCLPLSNHKFLSAIPRYHLRTLFYFEVQILRLREAISIGFANQKFPFGRQNVYLGEYQEDEVKSYSYNSDGQCEYRESKQITSSQASSFKSGDTVGCGISLSPTAVFFTKNCIVVAMLKFKIRKHADDWYPCVSVTVAEDNVCVNLGEHLFLHGAA